jgi:predicted cation transporter
MSTLGVKAFAFSEVVLLGLVSSVITGILAAVLFVEAIDCMQLDRKAEAKLVVIACIAIGMGAVLTPLSEHRATIVIAKLKSEPYNPSFLFLSIFWQFVVPGVFGFGALASMRIQKGSDDAGLRDGREEGIPNIFLRAAKNFLSVRALVFLGTSFRPIIDTYVSKLPSE